MSYCMAQKFYMELTFNHKKSLIFKYCRMQKEISSWLVCGSHGAYLDCMLLGVQVTTGLGFYLHSSCLVDNEDSDSCFNRLSLLSGIVYCTGIKFSYHAIISFYNI